jgi:hypothetical protein
MNPVSYEIRTGPGSTEPFVSGVNGPLELRRWSKSAGGGEIVPMTAPASSEPFHIQLFGRLALTPFGSKAQYPTEDREFRASVKLGSGDVLAIHGRCTVGAAG